MQTHTANQAGAAAATEAPGNDTSAAALMQDEGSRQGEEIRVLMAGFATGLTIAGVFLVYIILEFAKLLP